MISLLKAYFQIQPSDSAQTIRENVTEKVLALDRSFDAGLPSLLALLDVPVNDRQWLALDPPQRRQRTLDTLKRLLLRESQRQPLVLLFEDLHWIDSETQALLDSLVESLPTARVLLLTNYRPEYQHRWVSKTYYVQLRLDPLPPEDAEGLLRVLLGDNAAMEPLKRLLIEHTEGNPFFLEESVRTLIEAETVVGKRGASRVGRSVDVIEVPATVEAVLGARIDRLPPGEKRLLQAAAVVGKDVRYLVLRAVVDAGETELLEGLAHLQAAEFLYETRLFPEHEYTFKHALTHQVAYGGMLQDRRRALHAQVVKAIERLYAGPPDDEIPALANHAVRGELWEEAVTYHRRAGRTAGARCANREAVTHFEQALVALERLPESRERLERAFDLRLDARAPLWLLGEMERALISLREAEQLARVLGDEARTGWASGYLFNIFWMMGQPREARAYAERAVSAGDAVGDHDLQQLSSVNLAQLCLTSGDYREAQRVAQRGLEFQKGIQPQGPYSLHNGRLHALLGLAKACLGQFDEGIAIGLVGLHEAEASEYQFNIMYALTLLDRSYRLRGAFNQSEVLLGRTFRLMDEYGLTVQLAQHLASRGEGYLYCGRVAEGVALLEEALRAAKAKKVTFDLAQILLYLAEGYLVAGRADEALPYAREAQKLAHDRAERTFEGWALHLIGEIVSCMEPHDFEACETHYRDAIGFLEEIGARPWLARCHLGFGVFYRRTGRRQEAEGHLTTATTMLREMDMRVWLEQAEAELAALK